MTLRMCGFLQVRVREVEVRSQVVRVGERVPNVVLWLIRLVDNDLVEFLERWVVPLAPRLPELGGPRVEPRVDAKAHVRDVALLDVSVRRWKRQG